MKTARCIKLIIFSSLMLCLWITGCSNKNEKTKSITLKSQGKREFYNPIFSDKGPNPSKLAEAGNRNLTADEQKKLQVNISGIIKEATSGERSRQAVLQICDLINGLSADSKVFKESRLIIAKLLLEIGEEKVAAQIYDAAILDQWDYAFSSFLNALIDLKRFDEAAIYEYYRLTGISPFGFYRAKEFDFTFFNKILALLKAQNLPETTEALVYKKLEQNHEYPQSLCIARAFCLAYDGNKEEAIKILDSADKRLNNSSKPEREHLRSIPLYKMVILAKSSSNEIDLNDLFTEYADRNRGNINRIYHGLYGMIESFYTNEDKDIPKITSMTEPLISSSLFESAVHDKALTDSEISSIFDVHGQGFYYQGKEDEQAKYSGMVYKKFYPDTYAGVICGIQYANYLCSKGKCDEASQILERIIKENPGNQDYSYISANVGLANIKIQREEYKEALVLIENAIHRASIYTKGPIYKWYEFCLEMKKSVEEKMKTAESKKDR